MVTTSTRKPSRSKSAIHPNGFHGDRPRPRSEAILDGKLITIPMPDPIRESPLIRPFRSL
jgi:hypothetical protein